ncbi:MAG: hypothetical protein SCJ94_04815 [Bacillota bacterium]|nr:hypothetical protein [Bacillota bacterium]
MRGRKVFSNIEINKIAELLRIKSQSSQYQQKFIRGQMRNIGFYISDFTNTKSGFSVDDLDRLIRTGRIIVTDFGNPKAIASKKQNSPIPINNQKDEAYIIDLCDEVLNEKAYRQHRFDFLLGDVRTPLPVDAYYKNLDIVVEYREIQHTEPVKFFDKTNRLTVSNVHRGEQRKIYDQRRRDILPKHGIELIEISYTCFNFDRNKKIIRDRNNDLKVISDLLRKWSL